MKEFNPETVQETIQQANDVIENLRSIKGEKYVNAVCATLSCSHMMITISMFARKLKEIGVVEDSDGVYKGFADLMSNIMGGFMVAAGLDGEVDRAEVLKSSETLRELTTFGVKKEGDAK